MKYLLPVRSGSLSTVQFLVVVAVAIVRLASPVMKGSNSVYGQSWRRAIFSVNTAQVSPDSREGVPDSPNRGTYRSHEATAAIPCLYADEHTLPSLHTRRIHGDLLTAVTCRPARIDGVPMARIRGQASPTVPARHRARCPQAIATSGSILSGPIFPFRNPPTTMTRASTTV